MTCDEVLDYSTKNIGGVPRVHNGPKGGGSPLDAQTLEKAQKKRHTHKFRAHLGPKRRPNEP